MWEATSAPARKKNCGQKIYRFSQIWNAIATAKLDSSGYSGYGRVKISVKYLFSRCALSVVVLTQTPSLSRRGFFLRRPSKRSQISRDGSYWQNPALRRVVLRLCVGLRFPHRAANQPRGGSSSARVSFAFSPRASTSVAAALRCAYRAGRNAGAA
jgi:hypothetical protein